MIDLFSEKIEAVLFNHAPWRGPGDAPDMCVVLEERVRAVLTLMESWEATRWRKDGRESEWTRLMLRELRAALDGER